MYHDDLILSIFELKKIYQIILVGDEIYKQLSCK